MALFLVPVSIYIFTSGEKLLVSQGIKPIHTHLRGGYGMYFYVL